MSLDIQPGMHEMPMAVYLADPCPAPSLSSSIAGLLLGMSPLHAWSAHPRLNPNHKPRERNDFDLGTCAHALLLEGDESKLAIFDPVDFTGPRGGVPKGWTNDAIRKARDEARIAGKTPILKDDAEAVREMVAIARDYIAGSEIAGIFDTGAAEQTMIWKEGQSWLRARPDWLNGEHSIMLHYKTTARSAEPGSFGRSAFINMGYDMTAMFYERGLYHVDAAADPLGEGKVSGITSVFLVQEVAPPYACSLLALDHEMQDLAARKVERAISLWGNCMRTGHWPAYPNRICYLETKPWQVADFEEKVLTNPIDRIDPLQEKEGLQI